ncbi:MAG: hypothetical protein ACQEW8_07755 [Actinomycetota bacterium]
MPETQSPTPAGTSRSYRSLEDALRAHRIAPENHAFIAAIVAQTGVFTLVDRGRYIEGVRRGDGAPLHIGKTYTNGFAAGERIVHGGVVLRMQPSLEREPYLFVTHPSEFLPATAAKPARRTAPSTPRQAAAPKSPKVTKLSEREYGVCDVCFMVRRPDGRCDCD